MARPLAMPPNTTCDAYMVSQPTLGLDFGNASSKMVLSFMDGSRTSKPRLVRVPIAGMIESTATAFEFIASAAIGYDGRLVVGSEALGMDTNIPLKTLLTYYAGVTRGKTLEVMPGGRILLQAIRDKSINSTMVMQALREHFEMLWVAACDQMTTCQVKVEVVVLTYPNYLCAREGSRDFDKYMNSYLGIVRPLFGVDLKYETASEGQSVALYLCEPFDDPTGHSRIRQRTHDLFGDVRSDNKNITIVDVGSSTMNLQSVAIYFDANGNATESQSLVPHGVITGARGGSHMSNDLVRRMVEQRLQPVARQGGLADGDIASLLRDFEEKKKKVNYSTENDYTLYLVGQDPQLRVLLSADDVRETFEKSFAKGLKVLQKELWRMLDLGEDFGVLFCGGSFCSPGLHHVVKSIMAEFKSKGDSLGIQVTHTFLRNEIYWSSAVAAGAALSMMHLPQAGSILASSRIGIQEILRSQSGQGEWTGTNEAGVVWCNSRSLAVDIEIPADARRWLKLFLVCETNYHFPGLGAKINIEPAGASPSSNSYPEPYDLGVTIESKNLPHGTIRFSMSVAASYDHSGDLPVPVSLKCCEIGPRNNIEKNPKDRRYTFLLKVDSVTKLLQAVDEAVYPVWCGVCKAEILDVVVECADCQEYNFCSLCAAECELDNHGLTNRKLGEGS